MLATAAQIYELAFDQGLRPDPLLTVSEWADQHRRLSPRASSEPGPWRTSRTPYLKEIMDCLSAASPVERVVVMKGAQVGISECGNNWIGYIIHHAPGPRRRGVTSNGRLAACSHQTRRRRSSKLTSAQASPASCGVSQSGAVGACFGRAT